MHRSFSNRSHWPYPLHIQTCACFFPLIPVRACRVCSETLFPHQHPSCFHVLYITKPPSSAKLLARASIYMSVVPSMLYVPAIPSSSILNGRAFQLTRTGRTFHVHARVVPSFLTRSLRSCLYLPPSKHNAAAPSLFDVTLLIVPSSILRSAIPSSWQRMVIDCAFLAPHLEVVPVSLRSEAIAPSSPKQTDRTFLGLLAAVVPSPIVRVMGRSCFP